MINKRLYEELKKHRKPFSESGLNTVSIVCFEYEIEEAVNIFKNKYTAKIERICIPSYFPCKKDISSYESVPVVSLDDYYDKDNLAVYIDFYEMADNHWIVPMNMIAKHHRGEYYFYTKKEYEKGCLLLYPPLKGFYEAHKEQIDKAYSLLSSDKSKKIFLERLKSLIEGDTGYLEYNGELDYFPEELMPTVKKGSVVIDAGISSSIFELEEYSKMIGQNGRIYAFEASPIEYKKADKLIKNNPDLNNVELIELGLWNQKEKMQMAVGNGGSSVLYPITGESVECELVALDDFVKSNKINKVDYIKMDIESAEPNALKGAQKTIKKYKPDMAVCIYHSPIHLWEIILYINSLNIGYDFFIYHHSAMNCETVLYAVKPSLLKRFYNITKSFVYDIFHIKIYNFVKKYINFMLLKNRRVIVYGAGKHFDELYKKGKFKNINVIAVSDKKFENSGTYKGYTAITPYEILNYKPDIIYIAMQESIVAYNFLNDIYKEKLANIKFIKD